ncbi:hypothetical protein VTG60DRAFT_2256 [Thermothelomyces hinnuleus]
MSCVPNLSPPAWDTRHRHRRPLSHRHQPSSETHPVLNKPPQLSGPISPQTSSSNPGRSRNSSSKNSNSATPSSTPTSPPHSSPLFRPVPVHVGQQKGGPYLPPSPPPTTASPPLAGSNLVTKLSILTADDGNDNDEGKEEEEEDGAGWSTTYRPPPRSPYVVLHPSGATGWYHVDALRTAGSKPPSLLPRIPPPPPPPRPLRAGRGSRLRRGHEGLIVDRMGCVHCI